MIRRATLLPLVIAVALSGCQPEPTPARDGADGAARASGSTTKPSPLPISRIERRGPSVDRPLRPLGGQEGEPFDFGWGPDTDTDGDGATPPPPAREDTGEPDDTGDTGL